MTGRLMEEGGSREPKVEGLRDCIRADVEGIVREEVRKRLAELTAEEVEALRKRLAG